MGIKLTNNAFATLAAGINSSATSITLTAGQGARFPTLTASDYFYATLVDTSNNLEIVKCTARSTDVLTVVRAQETTTARAYSTGDRIEIRLTAATFVDAVNEIGPTQVSDELNSSTGYFDLPAGTTAQRPGSPHSGMQRWNTDLGAMEYYNGTAWSTNFQQTYPIDFLVIAGGGGGGHRYSGGGAGGYRTSVGTSGGGAAAESAITVTAGGSYAVTIGAGGAGGTSGTITAAANGNPSSLGLLVTSIGGGRGGCTVATDGKEGKAGGSGGGGTGDGDTGGTSISGGAGTTGQGYAGGAGWDQSGNNSGGGGGGAGQVGGSATSSTSVMAGGNGVSSSINNTATTRGGGGAPARQTPSDPGTAGTGGGGTAGGGNGSANTGGGGGCGRDGTGGTGGSGVVIIRYASATQRGTGGTVTSYTSGSTYWVHTFTSSGTFTA